MTLDTSNRFDAFCNRWMPGFLFLGVGLRLLRYAISPPLIADEAWLGINLLDRSWRQLMISLDNDQVAPLGFLWIERFIRLTLGTSEYALRLVPTLAGLAALLLFARWAKSLTRPAAACFATGVLAVGYFCNWHAVELKPYSIDLLAAIGFYFLATQFLLHQKTWQLAALIVLTPPVLFLSYPSIFVIAGINFTLLIMLPHLTRRQAILVLIHGLVLLAVFRWIVWPVAQSQYNGTRQIMEPYWNDEGFPPPQPLQFIWWFIKIHTENLFAYPIGGKNGGSTASTILFLVGLFTWLKQRRYRLVILLLLPFALNLVAAAMHRYPYGQAARTSQHLAPVIILLMGVGGQTIIEKFCHTLTTQRRAAIAIFVILMVCGITGLPTYLTRLETRGQCTIRHLARRILTEPGAGATIVVLQPQTDTPIHMQWYLRAENAPVIWNGQSDVRWQRSTGEIWVINWSQKISPDVSTTLETGLTHRLGRKPLRHEVWKAFPTPVWQQWDILIFPPASP